jgi:hypothetical protein
MVIPARAWIPGTTRNRWAWGFAWASLLLLLIWNLIPYFIYDHTTETWMKEGLVITHIWPNIVEGLVESCKSTPDVEDALSIIASLALIFLVAIQFLLAPLWQVISMSRLLRFIPASLCTLGLLVIMYFIIDDMMPLHKSDYYGAIMLSLIALNFLLTLIALLLYHPEPELISES